MKKILYFVFGFTFIFALTACDGELSLPSGITIPTDITIDDLTSGETTKDGQTTVLQTTAQTTTSGQTTDMTTEIPTSGQTTDMTTEIPTSGDLKSEEPTTTYAPTTQAPTTILEVTISFNSQGGNPVSPMTVNDLGQLTNMPVAVRVGYSFEGWFEDAETTRPFSNINMSSVDLTLYAKWTINQYTISFEENDGSDVADITQDYQSLVIPPTPPTRPGYIFLGWFENMDISSAYSFDTISAEDITLYAGWTPNDYQINYYDISSVQISDVFNTNYATYILTKDHHIYGSGKLYLNDANPYDQFTLIDTYFDLHDDEFIVSISGHVTMFALTNESRVFVWGTNGYGSGGVDSTDSILHPVDITDNFQLQEDEIIVTIDNNYNASYAITSKGRLFTWGYNAYYQLGDGTNTNRLLPNDITSELNLLEDESPIDVSFGLTHTLILTNQGRLKSVGSNYQGQLGLEKTSSPVVTLKDINDHFVFRTGDNPIEIETSQYGSYVLTKKGDVFVFGQDAYGRFGIDTFAPILTPTNLTAQYDLDDEEVIKEINVTTFNAFFKTSMGKLLATGSNINNQLFIGEEVDSIINATDIMPYINYDIQKSVFANSKTLILTFDNQVIYIGKNNNFESGSSNTAPHLEPYQIIIPGSERVMLTHEIFAYKSDVDMITPLKVGYTFMGWFRDPEFTNELLITTMPMEDIDAYAKWQANQYTITFEENDGSDVADITQNYQSLVTPPAPPTRPGYTFLGWFEDMGISLAYTFDTMPAEDISLYAGWTINQYDIIYITYDGDEDFVVSADYLSQITPPTDPVKIGYSFDGWYTDSELTNLYTFDTMPLDGISLYPKWEINQYTITFEENDGSDVADITQNYQSLVTPPAPPTRPGYTFLGWFEDMGISLAYTFDTMPAEDISLYAGWTINQYDIIYVTYDGDEDFVVSADYLSQITPPTDPVKIGYSFDGWYSDSELTSLYTFDTMPLDGITLYPKWDINQYTISFEENGGSLVDDLTVDYMADISQPLDPSKDGFTFMGWYTDINFTNIFVFDAMPLNGLTLFAKWQGDPATISFVIDDLNIDTISAFSGDLLRLPIPELMGRTFVNWYLEDDFQTPVTWNTMPAGDQTIYGKWSTNTYTLTYDSNGGSLVSSQTYLYAESVSQPADPTKTDYIFAGWYEDIDLLNLFDFSAMPAENLTLYAKWIDASDLTSIFNVSQEDTGTMVTVQGTVYATLRTGLYGFLIFDSTGYIAIDGAHDGLEIGDTVEVVGTLVKDDGAAHIYSVTSIQVIADAGDVLPIQTLDLGDLYDLTNLDVYKAFQSQGILIAMDENYYLMDPNTLLPIMIMSDSVEDTLELAGGLGNQISLTFAYFMPYGQPMASIIDYTITPLTIEEKGLTIKNSMMENHDLIFYSGDELPLNEFPLLGEYLTYSIAAEDEVYFDTTSHTFLSASEEVIIPFDITLSYMMQTYTFTIDVILKPLDISSIAEVIDDPSQNYHTIEALVVSKGEVDILLKDATGYLYAANPGYLNVGDLVRLVVRNDGDYPMTYLDFHDGDLVVKDMISSGNDLAMASVYYTGQDLLALDQNDLHIYGEYIEVRGFIQEGQAEENYGFYIHTEDFDLNIMALGHSGFEKLFDYVGVEVYMKGYVYRDLDGNMMLYFEGIRDDILIPDYTDQERVDVLEYMFNYYLGGQTFDAFQSFEVAPYHPVIGCDVSWAFTDPTFAYFDFDAYTFLPAVTDQPFSMDITISCGSASTTFVYTSSVNAIEILPLSEINDHLYEDAFVEGLVIFQSHEYIYIMDDLGHIIYVEITDPSVYVGDEVLLYGYLTQQYNTIYLSESYETSIVQDIKSRDNPVSILTSQMAIDDILNMDDISDFDGQIYIEIQGRIDIQNDHPYIHTPEGMIILMTPYEQVRYELYEYDGAYVTLRGYMYASNQYVSVFGQRHWTMNFVGEPGDVEILDLTNQEKFDFLQADILDRYQMTIENLQSINFYTPDFYFNDVDISYTALDDTQNLFNFTSSNIQFIEAVTEDTVVTIQVDMTAGPDTDSFTFTLTITPSQVTNITPIDGLISDGITYQNVQGQVIATSFIGENLFAMLIDDASGRIIVTIPRSLYESHTAYHHKYINDEIMIGGLVTNSNNQFIIHAEEIQFIQAKTDISHIFQERSVSDVLLDDMTDPNYIGTPYVLSGQLSIVKTNIGDAFYLNQGDHSVRIFAPEPYWSSLRNYMGYDINIRVFAYGYDENMTPAFLYTNRSYGSESSIELGDYTDEVILEMMMQSILDDHNNYNPLRVEGDHVWYPSPDYILTNNYPETTIVYEVISGNDYVTVENNYFITNHAPYDVEIVVQVSIMLNASMLDFTFSTYLNGYSISNLEVLFDPTPSTQEIALEAVVLHSSYNKHYFEIEGKVYKLDLFMYGGLQKGAEVMIIGQKSVIDGIADYTYHVQVIDQNMMGTITLTPNLISIEDLYTTDYDSNPLHEQINTIYGKLTYDPFLDLYILSDNGYMVYLEMLQEGWAYIDFLSPYLDEYVYLDILLPRDIIRNEFIKVDIFGGSSGVDLYQYTPQEDVALIKERLSDLGTIDVYGGDLLSDYLPNAFSLHPYTYITYTLVNSADALLYDETYSVFNAVSAQMTTQILATIQYYDPMDESMFTDTIVIDINIHPRTQSSVWEVLYGSMYETYQIEGYIVAFGPDQTDAFMIVYDGNEEIRVDLNPANMFNGDQLSLNLYDQVVIIGKRYPHQVTYLSPKLDHVTVINVISSNNTINNMPTIVSLKDLLDQTITDMTSFQDYISITGTFHWFGDPLAPNFYLQSEQLVYNGSFYRIVVNYPEGFADIETLKALDGQTLTITGYTRGYESLRVPLGWHMIYESHEIETD